MAVKAYGPPKGEEGMKLSHYLNIYAKNSNTACVQLSIPQKQEKLLNIVFPGLNFASCTGHNWRSYGPWWCMIIH